MAGPRGVLSPQLCVGAGPPSDTGLPRTSKATDFFILWAFPLEGKGPEARVSTRVSFPSAVGSVEVECYSLSEKRSHAFLFCALF